MSDWDPQRRDEELHTISGLSKAIAIGAVGGTVILGYGIALGDQQRADQAAARDAQAEIPASSSTGSVTPPPGSPKPSPSKSKSPKSKSGGS